MATILDGLTIDGTTGEIIGLPDNGRDSARYAWSDEDLAYSVPAYAAAFNDGRPVQNLLSYTGDLEHADWSTSGVSVTPGITDPDGGATAFTLTSGGGSTLVQDSTISGGGTDGTFIGSVWVRRRTGTGGVYIYKPDSSTINVTSTITSSWQKIYAGSTSGTTDTVVRLGWLMLTSGDELDVWHPQVEDATGRADTNTPSEYASNGVDYGDIKVTNSTFDADLTGWAATGDATAAWDASGAALITISGSGGGLVDDQSITGYVGQKIRCVIRIKKGTYTGSLNYYLDGTYQVIQSYHWDSTEYTEITRIVDTANEDVEIKITRASAATGTYYIDSITLYEATTGYAVYGTENGNSVASNVVTEAKGAALSPVPRLSHCPAATNSGFPSRNLTGTWFVQGTSVVSYNQIGVEGYPNTATLIDDDDATAYEFVRHTQSPISAGTTTVRVLYVKKDTNTTTFPTFRTWLYVGTAQDANVRLNTQTGATYIDGGDASNVSVESVQIGDWWRLSIAHTDVGGNTAQQLTIYPAYVSAIDGAPNAANTRSIILGNVETYKDNTIQGTRGLPPIFTTTAAVSTTADDYAYDIANHSDTELTYACEWTPGYSASEATGDQEIITLGTAPDMLYHDATNGDIESTDGTNTSTKAETITAGTTYDLEVAYSTGADSLQVSVDGVVGSDVSYDDAFPTGTKISLFRNSSYPQEMFAFTITAPDDTSIPVFAHHYMNNIG